MFVALFILLFVAQPVKGPSADYHATVRKQPEQKLQTDGKQDSAANQIKNQSSSCASCKGTGQEKNTATDSTNGANKKEPFDWNPWLVGGTWALAIAGFIGLWIARYTARR